MSLDAVNIGGQAGASSRIENYVGFPNGISGGELTAAPRSRRNDSEPGSTHRARSRASGWSTGSSWCELADGSEVPSRSVIVASGARYQRLAVDDLERFEGNGVYYAATDLEARQCTGASVIVVGGGNSAGQAAIYLAQQGSHVTICIRGDDLGQSMSRYLIERIDADTRIEVLTDHRGPGPRGDHHLERVDARAHADRASDGTVECAGSVLLHRRRSRDRVARRRSWRSTTGGFVLTDRSLPATALESGHVPRAGTAAVRDLGRRACSRSATCATAR